MKKLFRWLWFLCGTVGMVILIRHCWQRLDHFEAGIVTGAIVLSLLRWLRETFAYQCDIPKAEYRP